MNQQPNPNGAFFTPPPFVPPVKRKPVWPWVLAVCLLLFVLFIGFCILIASLGSSGDSEYPGSAYIAELHIEGTIAAESDGVYSHSYVMSHLNEFIRDKNNRALILYIDSPGGELYAVDEVYQLLLAYKSTGRPIYAYCATYAASGGYYLASTADVICANRMSTVGSIGVTYGYHIDLSRFLAKYDIDVTALASDENKSMGGYFSPLTDEQMAIYQSQINEYYNAFVDVVAAGRPSLTRAEIVALADGRTYTAKQALLNGLIDSVATYDEFLYTMRNRESLTGCPVQCYQYVYQGIAVSELLQLLGKVGSDPASVTESDLLALVDELSSLRGPLALYGGN